MESLVEKLEREMAGKDVDAIVEKVRKETNERIVNVCDILPRLKSGLPPLHALLVRD